ncbi:hypothetical protein CKO15_13040 [Halorhodospira abdelmalekii]|uniref:type II secretion system protein n=1 Tax=Halorhodospira abdelmalekii TaxID=421629 RepID=UPI001903C907|nr:type II secretion system protein [Halorhodospira abdelmalekii]MBK1736179.1 hypothetical protein [Halorhodospira abdelmalekii]
MDKVRWAVRSSHSARGFTLIELSIVMVVIGIIAAVMVSILPDIAGMGQDRNVDKRLERAEQAVIAYVAAKGRLPCPDISSPLDGSEGDCSQAHGYLPYKELGLSSGNDPWGNRMRYAVFLGGDGVDPPLTEVDGDDESHPFERFCGDCSNSYGLEYFLCEAAGDPLFGDDDHLAILEINRSEAPSNSDDAQQHVAFVIVAGSEGQRIVDNPINDDPLRYAHPNQPRIDGYHERVRAVTFRQLHSELGCGGL